MQSLENIIQLHQAAMPDPDFERANNIMGYFKRFGLIAELSPVQLGGLAKGVKGTILGHDRRVRAQFSISTVRDSVSLILDTDHFQGNAEIEQLSAFVGKIQKAMLDPMLMSLLKS